MQKSKKNEETTYDSYIISLIRKRGLQEHGAWIREEDIPMSLIEKLRNYAKLKHENAL